MKARIWNYRKWIKKCEPVQLKEWAIVCLKESGFKILEIIEYNFKPQGYTLLILLAESHFALHTFPEESRTYIELSSCNKEYFINAKKEIKQYGKVQSENSAFNLPIH